MRQTLTLLMAVILFYSCSNLSSKKVKNTAVIDVINGTGKKDTVRYTCDSCEKYINSNELFNKIIDQATKEAIASLKNPLSFIPRSIKIQVEPKDSFFYYSNNKRIDSCLMVSIDYECIGKNGYGVEGLSNSSSLIFLVGNKIQDNFTDIIRRRPLGISDDGKIADKSFTAYDVEGDGNFTILPTLYKPYCFIVNSTISCIDKGATLSIMFADKSEIKLPNWNSFNCKGVAYFNLSTSDIEQLKTKKVSHLSFYVESGKSQFARVVDNESDYFMQYISLLPK